MIINTGITQKNKIEWTATNLSRRARSGKSVSLNKIPHNSGKEDFNLVIANFEIIQGQEKVKTRINLDEAELTNLLAFLGIKRLEIKRLLDLSTPIIKEYENIHDS